MTNLTKSLLFFLLLSASSESMEVNILDQVPSELSIMVKAFNMMPSSVSKEYYFSQFKAIAPLIEKLKDKDRSYFIKTSLYKSLIEYPLPRNIYQGLTAQDVLQLRKLSQEQKNLLSPMAIWLIDAFTKEYESIPTIPVADPRYEQQLKTKQTVIKSWLGYFNKKTPHQINQSLLPVLQYLLNSLEKKLRLYFLISGKDAASSSPRELFGFKEDPIPSKSAQPAEVKNLDIPEKAENKPTDQKQWQPKAE